MKWLRIVVICIFAGSQALAFDLQDIPIQYITKEKVSTGPKEIRWFHLRTCGGDHVDGYTVTIHINLPDKNWNPQIGDFVYMTVYDLSGKTEIASNELNNTDGERVAQFNFTYHQSYYDLNLKVESGNVPFLVYTITAIFERPEHVPFVAQKQFLSSTADLHRFSETIEMLSLQSGVPVKGTDLASLPLIQGPHTVETFGYVAFQLNYCFNPLDFPGDILITIAPTDGISAFVTYVCTHRTQPCNSTEEAPYSDVSGSNVNYVKAHLEKSNADKGPLKLIVVGYGRQNKNNSFNILASKLIHDKPQSNNAAQQEIDQVFDSNDNNNILQQQSGVHENHSITVSNQLQKKNKIPEEILTTTDVCAQKHPYGLAKINGNSVCPAVQ